MFRNLKLESSSQLIRFRNVSASKTGAPADIKMGKPTIWASPQPQFPADGKKIDRKKCAFIYRFEASINEYASSIARYINASNMKAKNKLISCSTCVFFSAWLGLFD